MNDRILLNPTLSTYSHIFLKLIELRKQIDIIYVPYTSNSPLTYPVLLAQELSNVPYIISIHGGGMYSWRPITLHKPFFKHASAIIGVSEGIKLEYEKRSGKNITVIPPLVPFVESKFSKNELRNKYGYNEKEIILLTLGSIKKIKGSNILLRAFLRLKEKYIKKHNLKLLFVGDGPMRLELQEICIKYGYHQYIKFLGVISHKHIPDMFKLADIYVIPSLFEGMPISLLEAMFNGLPIIGSNTAGINDLIKHEEDGYLFDKGSIIDLETKIRNVVENMELSYKLGENAKNNYVINYNFNNIVLEYIKIMKNACGDVYD